MTQVAVDLGSGEKPEDSYVELIQVGGEGKTLNLRINSDDPMFNMNKAQALELAQKLRDWAGAPNTFDLLRKIVDEMEMTPSWHVFIHEEDNDPMALRVVFQYHTVHNYPPHDPFTINHFQPVPYTTYNEKTWRRWLYEQARRVMNHELGEMINFNGERPFVPMHGPGCDPYTVHEVITEKEALTTQRGTLREGPI